MADKETVDLATLSVDELAIARTMHEENVRTAEVDLGHIDMEYQRRLIETGGTVLACETLDIEFIAGSVGYDHNTLLPILEIEGVPDDELVGEGLAYRSPWVKKTDMPGAFNATKLKALGKRYGLGIPEIIAKAKRQGPKRFRVRAKKPRL